MNAVVSESATSPRLNLINSDISIELSPDQAMSFNPVGETFPKGSKVFITHLPGKPEEAQVRAAKTLADNGFTPVVHMGARNFDSVDTFVKLVESHTANGVTTALFLGGNPLRHTGPLDEALDLMRHPVVKDSTIKEAYISGYPEGHPAISDAELTRARTEKIALCKELGLEPRIVTQFGFDGKVFGEWAKKMNTDHPGVPVRIGLAGVTSLPKLIKFAMMCGVGASLAALKRNAGGLINVLSEKDPSDVIESFEATYPEPDSKVDLHFFPFGGWQKTLEWVSKYRQDRPM